MITEDPLRTARGCFHGLLLGGAAWLALALGYWWLWRSLT
jgi:hypothetical protein